MYKYRRDRGARLQTEDPGDYGYIPSHMLEKGNLICQRCFRIIHYHKDDLGPVLADTSLQALKDATQWADHVGLVVDLLDFEAGLPPTLLDYAASKPLVVLANKQDLLPKQTSAGEIAVWAARRLEELGVEAEVKVISALNGFGFPEVAQWIEERRPKLLIAGVTNVGKSHVIARILGMRLGRKQRHRVMPTVSAYPGTTVSWSRWRLSDGIWLADSPGFVPDGRLSDMLCPDCARELIPNRRLSSRLYPISPGEIMHVPGRAAVLCRGTKGSGLLIGYCGSGVNWERSTERHLLKWTREYGSHCPVKDWEEHRVSLPRNYDLTVHGLGWISARKTDYELTVYLPAGIRFSVRPCLIGPKTK